MMLRWLISLALGAAGGYLAARQAVRQELDEFRRELADLRRSDDGRRPAEPAAAPPPAPEPEGEAPAPAPEEEEVDETTAMLIAAAVAAWLGKRAVVRRARLVAHRSGDPWAVHGRVAIHASHNVINAHMTRH